MTKSEESKIRKAFVKYLGYGIPTPKVSTFKVWAKARFHYKYDEKKETFPCLACLGYGWVHDPKETPDVIEGYKMVAKVDCPGCHGSGYGTQSAAMEMYRDYRYKALKYRRDFLEKKRRAVTLSKALPICDLEALRGWKG